MSFAIQLGCPKFEIFDNDIVDETINVEEAIELIFPLETEFLIMIWNKVCIPLTYKYDVSIMINDFISILNFMNSDQGKELVIEWPSNTFSGNWILSKSKNKINISSKWTAVIGDIETQLNERNSILMDQKLFEIEIRKILCFLNSALKKSGLDLDKIYDYNHLKESIGEENY